jgi:hypothetical protein
LPWNHRAILDGATAIAGARISRNPAGANVQQRHHLGVPGMVRFGGRWRRPPPTRDRVVVTVDNRSFGLVRDTRRLKRGRVELWFEDVSAHVQPQTARLQIGARTTCSRSRLRTPVQT